MTGVYRDDTRGHFRLILEPLGQIAREVIGCDLGPTLHITMSGAHLTPNEVREFAASLLWWADRPHRLEAAGIDRLVEVNDLFLEAELPDA